jgi:hypothetical protein
MATFIPLIRAEKLPTVLKKYKKPGQLRKAVAAQVTGSKTWAKAPPSTGVAKKGNSVRVDVAAIPGVKALRKSGVVKK